MPPMGNDGNNKNSFAGNLLQYALSFVLTILVGIPWTMLFNFLISLSNSILGDIFSSILYILGLVGIFFGFFAILKRSIPN
jgi:uncharacterized RDD family membrane protein YckC